jgi:hypothetical protein
MNAVASDPAAWGIITLLVSRSFFLLAFPTTFYEPSGSKKQR